MNRMMIREEEATTMTGGGTPVHQALIDWLKGEIDRRNLSQSEAARRAGLSPNAINQIINGVQPGLRACVSIAEYFKVPLTRVLYMAGYISYREMEGRDNFIDEVRPLFDKMTAEQKADFLRFLRSIVGEHTL